MQSGSWSGCLGGRGEKLGKGPTSAVEALEQWALTSVGSCQVGGEGGAPLLKDSSSAAEIGFARSESRRGRTVWSQARTGVRAVGTASEVRD